MPYINQDRRDDVVHTWDYKTAGEFNYAVTKMITYYIEKNGESYQTYNDIMGALEGIKLELYRRKIAPYEDKKIKENGDVY